ncbi:MAG: sodium:proton antiporter [Pseudomonadales bacterium]|nr:sodium:proton antiporter [Pseudomonadales bacterium]
MEVSVGILLALILLLGISAQWLAWWLKLPSILFLLGFGILAGPVFGALNPDEMFGDLLFPFVSIGVAIVLFEGALTLRFSDIQGHGRVVTGLVSWGALMSWGLISAGCWWITDLSPLLSLMFGALVVVTGPTVVTPLLRIVKPTPAVSNILIWEGILIDPIGALLAVLVFEFIVSNAQGHSLLLFGKDLLSGLMLGAVGALAMISLLKRHWIPEYLQNVVMLGAVVFIFTLSNHFAEESGLLAVTVMGIWLANNKDVDIHEILSFKETLSILIVSVLFIVLAARLDLSQIIDLGWVGVGVVTVVILARPIVIWSVCAFTELKWQEKALISWIAPRGIVAAAVSALFAIRLQELGYSNASVIPALTFLIIITTVLLQSISARPIARLLGVAEEEARGVLIIGSNGFSRAVGLALQGLDYRVKIIDSSWDAIKEARMDGLDTYYGNPVSAHADHYLDLVGIGSVFAMSRRPALNTLACMKYADEFSKQQVFTLRNAEEKDESGLTRISRTYRTTRLFGADITSQKLNSLLGQGGEIKVTTLSEEFDFEAYRALYGNSPVLLMAIDPKQHIHPFTEDNGLKAVADWTLIALIPKDALEQAEVEKERGSASEDHIVTQS